MQIRDVKRHRLVVRSVVVVLRIFQSSQLWPWVGFFRFPSYMIGRYVPDIYQVKELELSRNYIDTINSRGYLVSNNNNFVSTADRCYWFVRCKLRAVPSSVWALALLVHIYVSISVMITGFWIEYFRKRLIRRIAHTLICIVCMALVRFFQL